MIADERTTVDIRSIFRRIYTFLSLSLPLLIIYLHRTFEIYVA